MFDSEVVMTELKLRPRREKQALRNAVRTCDAPNFPVSGN